MTSVTCPSPGTTIAVTVSVADADGCEYDVPISATSDCYSNAGASLYCGSIYCLDQDSADLASANCASAVLSGGTWAYDPASPVTCTTEPQNVTATYTDTATGCTYTTGFQVGPLTCEPGYYPDSNGTDVVCTECGYGYTCPDGEARVPCADFYTTNTTTATSLDECLLGECQACTTDESPPVYFTTGNDMSVWYTDAWTDGGNISKVCAFNTTEFDTINDIAIDANGDLILIVRKGSSKASGRMIKIQATTVQPPDPTRVCEYESLITGGFPDPLNTGVLGDAWAGLGSGPISNIMYGSSGTAIFTVDVSTTPPTYLGVLEMPPGSLTGSADITLGPDGSLYLAQATQMYKITLDGDGLPTLIEPYHANTVNMAGAFCTADQPIATENTQFHKLVEMEPDYTRLSSMILDPPTTAGFSGAATVPQCH